MKTITEIENLIRRQSIENYRVLVQKDMARPKVRLPHIYSTFQLKHKLKLA